jgi:hypothetical protein
MPAQNIAQDPIDDVGRAKTLIMPARLAQRQFGGPLDQCPLDGIEVFKPTQRLGELGGSALHKAALSRTAELAEGVPLTPFLKPFVGGGRRDCCGDCIRDAILMLPQSGIRLPQTRQKAKRH